MYDDFEQTLVRELDDVASNLDVPPRPMLPTAAPARRWTGYVPLLVAAAAVVAVLATVLTFLTRPDQEIVPAPSPTPADTGPVSRGTPADPVAVGLDLFVGGERVPGQWYTVDGRGTRWVGQRVDGSWWWGYGARPQRMSGVSDQPPAMSPSGGYLGRVVEEGRRSVLIGADTEPGGEGFGGVPLPNRRTNPAPRAVAVSDDGLVVARGADFQWLWRPLLAGDVVDLARTAPGQVVIGGTDAGLLVNEGPYDATDGTRGEPYLARLGPEGTLTRITPVPTHDVLEAGEEWLAYVPPGTVEGEASATAELRVERLDGSAPGALTPPDGWLFVAPGFAWESRNRLLALVVTPDGGDERLARCRPDPASCVLVDLP